MGLIIDAAAYSHIGGRKNNEDNFYMNGVHLEREQMNRGGQCNTDFSGPTQIYAVCDGMGGAMFGEEASLLAVKALKKYQSECDQPDSSVNIERMLGQISDGINQISYSRNMPAGASGSTIAMLVMHDWYFRSVHVGDSRIYRLRGGELEQITQDHSLVEELVRARLITREEARTHPRRNIITRALGTAGENVPDMLAADTRLGDVWLLCSDGLTGMVSDKAIADTINSCSNLDAAADSLLAQALDAGGKDNVTLILYRDEED